MENQIELSIYQILSSQFAFTEEDGQKIYERIEAAVSVSHKINVSFRDIKAITTTFLDTAFGQLYSKFTREKLNELISFSNICSADLIKLSSVLTNAKGYFRVSLYDTTDTETQPRDRRNWRLLAGVDGNYEIECCEGNHDRAERCEWVQVKGAYWVAFDPDKPYLYTDQKAVLHEEPGLKGWIVYM